MQVVSQISTGQTCFMTKRISQKPAASVLLQRIAIYLAGMLLLGTGITLSTRLQLGVSPISSVAYCISELTQMPFGDTTMILYVVYVTVQIILHVLMRPADLRSLVLRDLLQLPVSFPFTRYMNLLTRVIPLFPVDCAGTFWGGIPGRLLLLVLSIALTGTGAALSLDMRIVANPGDGIVQTIADFVRRKVGDVKNFFDAFCVLTTLTISFLGFHRLVGLGIGSIAAMLGVGRVIALVNHFFDPAPYLGQTESTGA